MAQKMNCFQTKSNPIYAQQQKFFTKQENMQL